jgi:HAMP domain-containing protein
MKFTYRPFWITSVLLLAFLAFSATDSFAQRRNEEEIRKIQDAKIAIITNRLNLTPEQSKDFWPIYNEFSGKKRELHRSMRQLINTKDESRSDDQVMSNLKEIQDLKEKQLALEKEYQSRFLTVISAKQLVELYKAERSFNEMLIQRLK